jgi:hypothetical protein
MMLFQNCNDTPKKMMNDKGDVTISTLNYYLFEYLDVLKSNDNLIIILSINACSGCTKAIVEKLKKIREFHKNVTVISVAFTSQQSVNQVKGLKNVNVFYDKTGLALRKESLYLTDNLAVIVKNKNIESYFYFNPSNRLDSILNLIDNYYGQQ